MKKLIILLVMVPLLLSAANTKPVKKPIDKKNSFQKYELGTELKDLPMLVKVRPSNNAHIAWDELNCQFYGLKWSTIIGDFTIPSQYVYFVFYKKKLLRIKLINPFRGTKGRDLAFFSALLAAFTQKYGSTKSTEPILTRYAGKYNWKTGKIRVQLTYASVIYSYLELEKQLRATMKKGKRIKNSDI